MTHIHPDTNLPINWCAECFYNGMKNGSLPWRLNAEDKTMQILYDLAKELGPPPPLPDSLKDECKLVKYLDYVDRQIIPISHTTNLDNEIKKRLFVSTVAELTIDKIPDVQDENTRANLTLRLWSGAWDAEKALRDYSADYNSDGTRRPDRKIPSWLREITFLHIEPLSDADPLRAVAEEVAPLIKAIRKESSFIDCIPQNSRVLKYIKNRDKLIIDSNDLILHCLEEKDL